jgi:predicted ABC-type transport system involved in lysophospholipase L1 biosynthesis ATPase subunit
VDNLAVRVLDLTKTYGTPAAPVHALRGVSMEVRRGERVALLGRSGSGKSTLLNILGGLDRPTSGSVLAAGQDLARLTTKQLADYRMTHVGIVFQSFHLVGSQDAAQNVELPMVFAGRPPRQRRAAARRALEAVSLGHRLNHYPAELSGGERQRVAIARALVNEPALLLADEPTGNLDTATAAEVIDLLIAHLDRHCTTLILVTHDEELARRHTSRVLRMTDGRLQPS